MNVTREKEFSIDFLLENPMKQLLDPSTTSVSLLAIQSRVHTGILLLLFLVLVRCHWRKKQNTVLYLFWWSVNSPTFSHGRTNKVLL